METKLFYHLAYVAGQSLGDTEAAFDFIDGLAKSYNMKYQQGRVYRRICEGSMNRI